LPSLQLFTNRCFFLVPQPTTFLHQGNSKKVSVKAKRGKAKRIPKTTVKPNKPCALKTPLLKTPPLERESPRKMIVDNRVCNHRDLSGLMNYGKGENATYFKEHYLASNPTFPSACDKCKKTFCYKKASDCDAHQWSARSGSVHLCKFGANISEACCFGLCGDCMMEQGGPVLLEKRSRKRKNLDLD
jgi:hypothetical protein